MGLNYLDEGTDNELPLITKRVLLGRLGQAALLSLAITYGAPVFGAEPEPAPVISQAVEVAPTVEYLTQDEVKRQYENGFNRLMTGVGADFDPEKVANDAEMPWLEMANTFYRNNVVWITDLSQATDPKKGYIYVYPKENTAVFKDHLTLEVGTEPGVKILKIKPVAVSEQWAGVFLAHEIEHLFDQVEGWEPSNPSIDEKAEHEVYAYLTEWAGVNRLSGGKYTVAIDELIREMQLNSPDQVFEMLMDQRRGTLIAVLEDRLGVAITQEAPKSEQERNLRAAFYLITFMMRLGEQAESNGIEIKVAPTPETLMIQLGALFL